MPESKLLTTRILVQAHVSPVLYSRSVFIINFCNNYTAQQECSLNNLPDFGDRSDSNFNYPGRPPNDRLQAIVPALNFTCAGRVTQWRACVDPGNTLSKYYMQFQVWRSTGIQGCYTLVGSNAPPLSASGAVDQTSLLVPSEHCVVLSVAENEQIEFQPGDVIGYYADRYHHNGKDRNDGGVQWIPDSNVVVYHTVDVPLSDLKTEYAISPLVPDPASCGFNIATSTSDLHDLSIVTSGAPIITLTRGIEIYRLKWPLKL